MNHMDIYIHYKYLKPRFGYKAEPFMNFMRLCNSWQKYPTYDELIDMFYKKQPTTTQVVQALDRFGIAPNTIADWLEISKQAVSYHRSRPANVYFNTWIDELAHPENYRVYAGKREMITEPRDYHGEFQ